MDAEIARKLLMNELRGTLAKAVYSDTLTLMLSAFTARPIVELKQRDKSKIEAVLAYGEAVSTRTPVFAEYLF